MSLKYKNCNVLNNEHNHFFLPFLAIVFVLLHPLLTSWLLILQILTRRDKPWFNTLQASQQAFCWSMPRLSLKRAQSLIHHSVDAAGDAHYERKSAHPFVLSLHQKFCNITWLCLILIGQLWNYVVISETMYNQLAINITDIKGCILWWLIERDWLKIGQRLLFHKKVKMFNHKNNECLCILNVCELQ